MSLVAATQAAVIGADTLDPMHDDSLWAGTNGFYVWGSGSSTGGAAYYFPDHTGEIGTLDPNDTEAIAYGLQRVEIPVRSLSFDYQTSAGLAFSTVQVCVTTMEPAYKGALSYEDATGAYVDAAASETYLGATSNWYVYLLSYDLSSFNTDRVRITIASSNTNAWYTPIVSSVAMTVVPEPITLAMLAAGGVAMLRRRK
jgi:hypothetical protein